MVEFTKHVNPEIVYCKNCVWLRRSWIPPFLNKCIHPRNWKDTWLKKERGHPWDINKNNRCVWFEGCSQSLNELRSKPY